MLNTKFDYLNSDLDEFVVWLGLLTASEIASVELNCYRNGKIIKAKSANAAGWANCGVEFLEYTFVSDRGEKNE